MTQPASRDDDYEDDDAPIEPVEHVALSDPEFKKQLAQVIPPIFGPLVDPCLAVVILPTIWCKKRC